MKIACFSGKGGTGKTWVAVNLAYAAGAATYIDCDVEEPNGHLFLKPETCSTRDVTVTVPVFRESACDGCKECVKACRFHALVCVGKCPTVFPQVCHSCGACQLVCPKGAVTETERKVGELKLGRRDQLKIVTGCLNPGEASGVPVIRAALKQGGEGLTVIDGPPGSACSVMECAMEADYCLLVMEPTAFGFHNFLMVYELVKLLGKPCGVLINKELLPYAPVEEFCAKNSIEVLARIPYDPRIAAEGAKGEIITQKDPRMLKLFRTLGEKLGGIA